MQVRSHVLLLLLPSRQSTQQSNQSTHLPHNPTQPSAFLGQAASTAAAAQSTNKQTLLLFSPLGWCRARRSFASSPLQPISSQIQPNAIRPIDPMVVVKNEVYSDGGLRASEEEGAAATAAAAHPRKGLGGGDGGSRRTNSSINIPHAVEEVDFSKSLSPTEGKAVLNPDGASRLVAGGRSLGSRIEDRVDPIIQSVSPRTTPLTRMNALTEGNSSSDDGSGSGHSSSSNEHNYLGKVNRKTHKKVRDWTTNTPRAEARQCRAIPLQMIDRPPTNNNNPPTHPLHAIQPLSPKHSSSAPWARALNCSS